MMASWTPQYSTLFSILLDGVIGTQEDIGVRQDYCCIYDCIVSICNQIKIYFTGSRSEGLDLKGSDVDR